MSQRSIHRILRVAEDVGAGVPVRPAPAAPLVEVGVRDVGVVAVALTDEKGLRQAVGDGGDIGAAVVVEHAVARGRTGRPRARPGVAEVTVDAEVIRPVHREVRGRHVIRGAVVRFDRVRARTGRAVAIRGVVHRQVVRGRHHLVIDVPLLHVGKDGNHPVPERVRDRALLDLRPFPHVEIARLSGPDRNHEAGGEAAVVVVVRMEGHANLVEVVVALDARRRGPDFLHGGQQQPNQDGDDGNHHQEFDQREGGSGTCANGARWHSMV